MGDYGADDASMHRKEMEYTLLSACAQDEDALAKAVDSGVTVEVFHHPEHRIIWRAMWRRMAKGEPADIAMLCYDMAVDGTLSSAGGTHYVHNMATTGMPMRAQAYIDTVLEATDRASMRERLQKALHELDHGAELGELQIDASSRKTHDGAVLLSDTLLEVSLDLDSERGDEGITTSFPSLDRMLAGPQPGDLVIVAGRPGSGKTSLALNICEHVARNEGTVLVHSLEMGKRQLAHRLISRRSGVPSRALRKGDCTPQQKDAVQDAITGLLDADLSMWVDSRMSVNVAQIRAQARSLQRKHDLMLVCVDYLQLMGGDKGLPREQQVAAMSRSLKALAKELRVVVLLLCQVNRQCEARPDKRPALADLRESGAVEQDADSALFCYRPWVYFPDKDPTAGELIIAKNRHGPTGTVNVSWDGPTTTFRERTYQQRTEA